MRAVCTLSALLTTLTTLPVFTEQTSSHRWRISVQSLFAEMSGVSLLPANSTSSCSSLTLCGRWRGRKRRQRTSSAKRWPAMLKNAGSQTVFLILGRDTPANSAEMYAIKSSLNPAKSSGEVFRNFARRDAILTLCDEPGRPLSSLYLISTANATESCLLLPYLVAPQGKTYRKMQQGRRQVPSRRNLYHLVHL